MREKICTLNIDLVRYGLVAWTAGNVSERMPDGKSFMIKPSGVSYDDLTPAMMVLATSMAKSLKVTSHLQVIQQRTPMFIRTCQTLAESFTHIQITHLLGQQSTVLFLVR